MFEEAKASDPKESQIIELERMVGRMAVQLDIAKKVLGRSDYRLKEDEEWYGRQMNGMDFQLTKDAN